MRAVPVRALFFAGLAALAPAAVGGREGASPSPAHPPRDRAIERAAEWLWSRQGADGGWHSETYGLLRSGESLTPFVLRALLEVPEEVVAPPEERVQRAWAFIRERVDGEGALGRGERLYEDYPNYATALAVLCFADAKPAGWKEAIAPMVACLLRQQFAEDRGWSPDHPAHGGWGMGGPLRRSPEPGHVDLSMTRFVLQALAAAGLPADHPAFARARLFLERCQPGGDGFLFSPVVLAANKAGCGGEGFRPYGSPTADGVLSLLAVGANAHEPRLRGAAGWLRRNHRTDRVPGIPESSPERWGEAMRFYYLAASAEAFARIGPSDAPEAWQEGTLAALREGQRPDGSFANGSDLGKEDDPLVATPFALLSLLASPRG
ncbi:MAG TPA: prenyltransferase/squalene oxidase repeat-containing protein [Planctomycetota bacterium]|jgi:squalene-hopene/tetraprenyl-beta-curcumene cyclase|nr:prenyltransferase/squalene oxidase repeat-containing protein [Planctomycetota bacterium]